MTEKVQGPASYFPSIEKLERPLVIRRFAASRAKEGAGIDAQLELELYLPK